MVAFIGLKVVGRLLRLVAFILTHLFINLLTSMAQSLSADCFFANVKYLFQIMWKVNTLIFPMEEIKKELKLVELSDKDVEELLQVLSMNSLNELEDAETFTRMKTNLDETKCLLCFWMKREGII